MKIDALTVGLGLAAVVGGVALYLHSKKLTAGQAASVSDALHSSDPKVAAHVANALQVAGQDGAAATVAAHAGAVAAATGKPNPPLKGSALQNAAQIASQHAAWLARAKAVAKAKLHAPPAPPAKAAVAQAAQAGPASFISSAMGGATKAASGLLGGVLGKGTSGASGALSGAASAASGALSGLLGGGGDDSGDGS